MDSTVNVPRWKPNQSPAGNPPQNKPTATQINELEVQSIASEEDDNSLSVESVRFPFNISFASDTHDSHHLPFASSPSLKKIEMEATTTVVGQINDEKQLQFSSKDRNNDGIFCTWKDLRVTVGDGKNSRRGILQGLTGYAQPGEVLCVMGPSGCGKSTLLDALAGRLSSNTQQTGEILINGRKETLAFGTSHLVVRRNRAKKSSLKLL
ncbi:protein scarlet isoform X2 [Manihot esculenta]|uniref:ABC transporter domain-containing protein n=1 Tax=Manihot esculenta TaxID=3983 RepID=A0A2C9UXA1_MANES|nr:protein scarlet isoform X2 [Manihot esculenta]OAY35798.1 hypothetical protein MANES_12G131200v8 [Manihot esculenta]